MCPRFDRSGYGARCVELPVLIRLADQMFTYLGLRRFIWVL